MNYVTLTYQIQVTSKEGFYPIRKTPYYSLDRAVYGLKQRLLLTDELAERYKAGEIIFHLIHYVNQVEVAQQRLNINL